MKVYFHASVLQRPKYGQYYARIVKKIIELGHSVDATHAMKHELNWSVERCDADSIKVDYEELMARIVGSDIVICEITYPSTIMTGHVLTRALESGKPVLALYLAGTHSVLLRGFELERFRMCDYTDSNLESVLEMEMEELMDMPDQRFTLLMQSDLIKHLDRLADEGENRSEYIRDLIRKDMKTWQ